MICRIKIRRIIDWLLDGRDYLTDTIRSFGLSRGGGVHVRPAGEYPDELTPPAAMQVIPIAPVAGRPPWEVHHARPGENEMARNWTPDYAGVLAPHVIAGLEHATADETTTDVTPARPDLNLNIQYPLGQRNVDDAVEELFGWLKPAWAA